MNVCNASQLSQSPRRGGFGAFWDPREADKSCFEVVAQGAFEAAPSSANRLPGVASPLQRKSATVQNACHDRGCSSIEPRDICSRAPAYWSQSLVTKHRVDRAA